MGDNRLAPIYDPSRICFPVGFTVETSATKIAMLQDDTTDNRGDKTNDAETKTQSRVQHYLEKKGWQPRSTQTENS